MQNAAMNKTNDLLDRTRQFALETIKFWEGLPKDETSRILGRQLLRAGTSVGANYRAACRAKSRADFISKMGTVEGECDETLYWLELLVESGHARSSRVADLMHEGNELIAPVVASINTWRRCSQSAIRNPQSAMG